MGILHSKTWHWGMCCMMIGVLFLLYPAEIHAGVGNLLKKKANEVKKKAEAEIKKQTEPLTDAEKKKTEKSGKNVTAEAEAGKIVFSTSPIDIENPANLTDSFVAGDTIYSLIQIDKPWKEVYSESSDDEKTSIGSVMFIDGKRYFQYITVTGEMMDATHLLLDIAPDPEKMTAYRDPEVSFPDSMGSKWGPAAFTDKFSQLDPGTHTIEYQVIHYSDVFSSGSFTLEGDDYSAYAEIHSQIKQELEGKRGFPAAKMTDKDMESKMRKLCENAGWKEIKKLHIVSEDWWYERESGGDSPFKARYLEAAVAAEDDQGCYYCIVIFHQDALLGGGWGELYLSHTGAQKKLPCENIQ